MKLNRETLTGAEILVNSDAEYCILRKGLYWHMGREMAEDEDGNDLLLLEHVIDILHEEYTEKGKDIPEDLTKLLDNFKWDPDLPQQCKKWLKFLLAREGFKPEKWDSDKKWEVFHECKTGDRCLDGRLALLIKHGDALQTEHIPVVEVNGKKSISAGYIYEMLGEGDLPDASEDVYFLTYFGVQKFLDKALAEKGIYQRPEPVKQLLYRMK